MAPWSLVDDRLMQFIPLRVDGSWGVEYLDRCWDARIAMTMPPRLQILLRRNVGRWKSSNTKPWAKTKSCGNGNDRRT